MSFSSCYQMATTLPLSMPSRVIPWWIKLQNVLGCLFRLIFNFANVGRVTEIFYLLKCEDCYFGQGLLGGGGGLRTALSTYSDERKLYSAMPYSFPTSQIFIEHVPFQNLVILLYCSQIKKVYSLNESKQGRSKRKLQFKWGKWFERHSHT